MSVIAGMDLGFGSQVKIVRTNYLVMSDDAAGTAQSYANLLQLYNYHMSSNQRGKSGLLCDYIIPTDYAAGTEVAVAPTSGTDPSVADISSVTLVSVMGPSRSHLAQQADLAAHQDSVADLGSVANGEVLAVLSAGLVRLTSSGAGTKATTLDGAVAVDTLGGTGGLAQLMMSNLLADFAGVTATVKYGGTPFIDLAEAHADLVGTFSGTATLDMTDTDLTTGFVLGGNAAGTTATEGSDVTGFGVSNQSGIISVVTLVRNAQ